MLLSQILIHGCFKINGRKFQMRDSDLLEPPCPKDMALIEDCETGELSLLGLQTEVVPCACDEEIDSEKRARYEAYRKAYAKQWAIDQAQINPAIAEHLGMPTRESRNK